MSYNNGIISAPVDVSDPYYVMGVGKYNGDWNNDYICSNQHGKINPAAKYKPVRSKSIIQTDNNWYKGDDLDCGVLIENLIYPDTSMPPEPWQRWTYKNVPQFDVYWLRMLDFEGYNHNSTFPFTTLIPTIYTGGFTCVLNKDLNIGGIRDKMVCISDLAVKDRIDGVRTALDKLYLALVVRRADGYPDSYRIMTTSEPIGDNKYNDDAVVRLQIPPDSVSSDTVYDFYLCLARDKYTSWTGAYAYFHVYNLNYVLNGVSNLPFKVDTRPIVSTKPILLSVEWINLDPGTGNTDGVRLTFDQYSPDFLIDGTSWKMDMWGSPLPYPQTIEFFVYKPKGVYVVDIDAMFSIDVSHAGTVNCNVLQQVNGTWVQELSQTLPV